MNATISKAQALGAGIAHCRQLRGLSQRELGEQLELSRGVIGHIETGHRPVKKHELMAIAHVLDVPLEWLRNPPVPPTVSVSDLGPSHDPAVGGAHNVLRMPQRDRSDVGGEVESTTVHYLRASQPELPDPDEPAFGEAS